MIVSVAPAPVYMYMSDHTTSSIVFVPHLKLKKHGVVVQINITNSKGLGLRVMQLLQTRYHDTSTLSSCVLYGNHLDYTANYHNLA